MACRPCERRDPSPPPVVVGACCGSSLRELTSCGYGSRIALAELACPGRQRLHASLIQLLVAPEDTLLVEGNAALACEIGLDVRPRRDAVVQLDEMRHLALERLHAIREGIAQPCDELDQREVHIGRPASGNVGATALLHP